MGERQVVRDHKRRNILDTVEELIKLGNGRCAHWPVDADENIYDLAHAGPVRQRHVLQLRVHERYIRCVAAYRGQVPECLKERVFVFDSWHSLFRLNARPPWKNFLLPQR